MNLFPKAPLPSNEVDRLKALRSYNILESGQEKNLDELAKLASYICGTPIGLINFIDEERQYEKSAVGMPRGSRPREDSVCQYTILQDDILEIQNLAKNDIFKFNPLIREDPNFRFYAGMPLSTAEGYHVGALCVIDTKPGKLNAEQKKALRTIAKQVMTQLEMRKLNTNLKREVEHLLGERFQETKDKLTSKELEANLLQKSIDKANATIKFDLNGKILSANKLFCKMMGYQPKELIGQDHSLLISKDELKETHEKYWEKLRQGVYHRGKFIRITKNGNKKWIEANYNPIFDEQGKLVSILNISHDITNEVQYQKDLEKSKLVAEKALEANDKFLSNMSHEIRTPLNAIIGFSDILKNEKLNDAQTDHVNTILQAGKNLLSIVNDILDLSKIESCEFALENNPFSPAHVIKSVEKMLREKAEEKNILLESNIDKKIPKMLSGDEFRLSQIIINLVSNAIKFTSEGFVKISASAKLLDEENCTLNIRVQDSGIGIPKQKQKMIYERFTQADTDTTRKYGGTGLGLNIVKLLTENFKGDLSIKSKLGEGSLFSVSIPFKIEHELEDDKQEVNQKQEFLAGRILMFEDNLLNQKLGQKILTDLGHELTIVSNGEEGVEWLKHNEADLILMDLQMPKMDGYQATSVIRKDLELDLPIIAMTAHSLGQEKTKCIQHGMSDYLSKPFKPEDLNRKIQAALSGIKKSESV
ncbi:response regulator [Psychroflexus sp. YR1-1]|uniref:histidine kinase n=1 Tax=Psychroflexus aurantiacus TaxID=2709310 RepID=A0A6B3R1R6_9FLAO|nr:ATP-binding protein [Psychroflexus aurantiacus]NEV94533.1 response regulator [Psychroflexus aurantiacus]